MTKLNNDPYKDSCRLKFSNSYFKELSALTLFGIKEHDILTVEKTKQLKEVINKNFDDTVANTITIKFSEKYIPLNAIFYNIASKGEKVYLFTKYSNYCGAALIDISDFNVNFEFSAEHAGIVTMVSIQCSDQLIIDFYELNGIKMITIECIGNSWGHFAVNI
jgi:hypothetical protein